MQLFQQYTPGDGIVFSFSGDPYTPPLGDAVDFNFGNAVAFPKIKVGSEWKIPENMYICINHAWRPITEVRVCKTNTWHKNT